MATAVKTEQSKSLNDRINEILSTTQGKTYTTVIATVVVVMLMAIFAIVPAYVSITDQIALNEDKTKYLADLSLKQSTINDLVLMSDKYENELKLLDIYFKDKINSEFLVASFSKIAEDHRCRTTSVSFGDPFKTKAIKELSINVNAVPFNLVISCNIKEMEGLFAQINDFPVPLNITGIIYTNKKEAGSVANSAVFYDRFNMTITGEYYYWVPPSTSTQVTTE
jgi:hypothetical protein